MTKEDIEKELSKVEFRCKSFFKRLKDFILNDSDKMILLKLSANFKCAVCGKRFRLKIDFCQFGKSQIFNEILRQFHCKCMEGESEERRA